MCGTGYEPEECLFSKKSSRLVHSSSLACEFGARRLLEAAVFLVVVVVRRAELARNAANPLESGRFVRLSLQFQAKGNKQFESKHKDWHELTLSSGSIFHRLFLRRVQCRQNAATYAGRHVDEL